MHFYAAQHKLDEGVTIGSWRMFDNDSKKFKNAANNAINHGYPLFVSEYGTVSANGDGSVNSVESDKWHSFMDANKISSCNWSINNKNEGTSAFVPGFNIPASGNDAAWTNTGNMTESGKYIYNKLVSYTANADWRNPSNPSPSSSSNGSTPISPSPSSNSNGGTPIFISQTASKNMVQLINNGVNLQVAKNAELEVFNINGNSVRKLNFENGIYSVEFQNLPKGLYVVKIKYGNSGKEVLKMPLR